MKTSEVTISFQHFEKHYSHQDALQALETVNGIILCLKELLEKREFADGPVFTLGYVSAMAEVSQVLGGVAGCFEAIAADILKNTSSPQN